VNALGASSNLNILWTCCDLLLIDRLVSGSSWHQKLMEWTTWDQHLCFMFSVISDLVYVLMQQTHWYPLVILFQTPTLCSAYFWLLLLFYMIGFSNLTHKYLCLRVSVMCICSPEQLPNQASCKNFDPFGLVFARVYLNNFCIFCRIPKGYQCCIYLIHISQIHH